MDSLACAPEIASPTPALSKYAGTEAKVETARGCILAQESFRDLVKEIDHGNYDAFLTREWPEHAR